MAARSKNYDVLTDDQKRVLTSFYDNGMNSTGSDMRELMVKASDQAGTSYEKVKKWIGNERSKRKLSERTLEENMGESSQSEIVVKGPPIKRMASGYNIFSSKLLSSDACKKIASKAEKMSFVASEWQSLSDNERSIWKDEAKKYERIQPSMLTAEERRKQIAKGQKNLIKDLSYLESLGCELAVIMVEPNTGTVNQYGSNNGVQFLLQNETMALKFMEFFDCRKPDSTNYTRGDVQDVFNKKYSDACGIPGCRVPYIKGGFTVTGLPKEIPFKKPSCYGVDQINNIMKHQENIVFHLTPEANSGNSSEDDAVNNIEISHDAHKALCKVVDEEKVDVAVAGRAVIEESELEVTDIQLSEHEFQLLTTKCRQYFTEDAWSSLKANYESCCKHEGYILPVYTESEDPYWLFYYPGKISELQNLQPGTKIWGYWLNRKEKLTYELLLSKKKMAIDAISIISNITGENESSSNLVLRQTIVLRNKNAVTVSESFHNSVLACLQKHGFL